MEIGLGAFIRFANASPKARPRVARQIAEQVGSDYDPATDFWRPMRQAIHRDRKTTRDGTALREMVLKAPDRRRPSFEEVTNRWDDVATRWSGASFAASRSTRADLGELQVRLSPLFAERWNTGRQEAAYLWFNKEPLQSDTVHAVQHLLAREVRPEVEPVFVDVRRAVLSPAVSFERDGIEMWLADLAQEYRRHTD